MHKSRLEAFSDGVFAIVKLLMSCQLSTTSNYNRLISAPKLNLARLTEGCPPHCTATTTSHSSSKMMPNGQVIEFRFNVHEI